MSQAVWLAAGAAGAGVAGAWEALAAVERTRVAAAVARVLEPLARAGREGRVPTRPSAGGCGRSPRRRCSRAGWLVGGVALGLLAALAGPGGGGRGRPRAAAALARGAAPRRAGVRPHDGRRARRRALDPHRDRGRRGLGRGRGGARAGHRRPRARVGEPTEAVLVRLRTRAGSHAWDTLTAAVLLQRDAGGDLAALLRELAASGEAADRAERDARAATAQARFTAWLVLGLPLGRRRAGRARRPGLRRLARRRTRSPPGSRSWRRCSS